jgi:dsRNA-specific ribonuclease
MIKIEFKLKILLLLKESLYIAMSTLKDFIQEQLRIARINEKYVEQFTDEKGMIIFTKAFTHPTGDSNNNYEELEFIGDGIIKGVLSQYINRRFGSNAKANKKNTMEGYLSKIRRYLEKGKTLGDFALKLGYWPFVIADVETKNTKRAETLENVYEAFVGALTEMVDERIKQGLGYYFAYNYVSSSLDELTIDINAEMLDDPITRLNELYKANVIKDKPVLKWGDAVYGQIKLVVPKLNAPPANASAGDTYFSETDKSTLTFDGTKWVNSNSPSLINIKLKPHPTEIITDPETKKYINGQLLWVAEVYGYPSKLGTTLVLKPTAQELLANPNMYGAEIIGRGINFIFKKSKETAATSALNYLKQRGYYM